MLPGVTGSKKVCRTKTMGKLRGLCPRPPEFSALEATEEAGKEKAG